MFNLGDSFIFSATADFFNWNKILYYLSFVYQNVNRVDNQNIQASEKVKGIIPFDNLWLVFSFFWAILFFLYLPAAEAGRVGDFPGWVHFLNSVSFIDYINRKGSGIPSMYQFTQVVTFVFYKLFGYSAWLWHLLYITLQGVNALLLYILVRNILLKSSANNAAFVAFLGAFLFCVCPHISEVVVWEPSFHYLLGLLLLLSVVILSNRFLNTLHTKYAIWGALIFFLSTYSLEVFYLTPFFVVALGIYYRLSLQIDNKIFKNLLLYFSLPQVIFYIIYFLLLRSRYHESIAHIGTATIQLNKDNLSKALKYIFHIVFLGRYFPLPVKNKIYGFCESQATLFIFYFLLVLAFLWSTIRYHRLTNNKKALFLFFVWVFFALGIILPLTFPDHGLITFDRYTYVACAFIYVFLAQFFNTFFPRKIFIGLVLLYALLNMRFTHRANAYWQQSAHIVNTLVKTFPNDPSKKVLLLSLPECLDGVQMIGTRDDGEFRMLYNATMPHKVQNTIYDVEAFYMYNITDGAHVTVLDDSSMRITLNQWGSYWLYYGFGAASYENEDYKVNMRDVGHMYELTLKHPVNDYLILFSIGDKWRTVDWSRKNVDQY